MSALANPAVYCAGLAVQLHRKAGVEPPDWLLDHERECQMSPPRHETHPPGPHSEHDDIGTTEAARIIGLSERQVQRRQADFGGRRTPSGQLVFDRRRIIEYAEWRRQELRHGA